MKVLAIPEDGDLLLIQRINAPTHLPHAGQSVAAHDSRDSLFPGGVCPDSTPGKTTFPMHPLDGRPTKNSPKRLKC